MRWYVALIAAVGLVTAQHGTAQEGPARDAAIGQVEVGIATVYAPEMQGQLTASGAPYDRSELTAAHRTLPIGTRVCVVNGATGLSAEVRVNDRWGGGHGRVINLSERAAEAVGFGRAGTAEVRLEVVEVGNDRRMAPAGGWPAPALPARLEGTPAQPLSASQQCVNEASILGLTDDFFTRHVRTCMGRQARAARR